MRAPSFWDHDGCLARALAPLGALYGMGGWVRERLIQSKRSGVPVICVGNVVAGGAGKTPTVLALAEMLLAEGRRVGLLSRGYGGSLPGPIRVDPGAHTAAMVGDEPLLLARVAPTWIARDRVAGIAAMRAAGVEIVVMDDGLQNPSVAKDCVLLVIDGRYGLGNGRVMPAGPLREPFERALARAHAVVIIGADETALGDRFAGTRIVRARIAVEEAEGIAGTRLLAFAGIGRPEKFFATLDDLGAELVDRVAFADHYRYQEAEITRLIERAQAMNATLITTAKDHVRLPARLAGEVRVLPVRLVWEDAGQVREVLRRATDHGPQ